MKTFPIVWISLLLISPGCGDSGDFVDSSSLASSQIIARFDVLDSGDGERVATAAFTQADDPGTSSSSGFTTHPVVRLSGEDHIVVSTDLGKSRELPPFSDPDTEGYRDTFDAADGDVFTFTLKRASASLVSTVTVPQPIELVSPVEGESLQIGKIIEVHYVSPGGRPTVVLDSRCAWANENVVGPGTQGDGFHSVNVSSTPEAPPCDGVLRVALGVDGTIDPGLAAVSPTQTSQIRAVRTDEHDVHITP
jgi:hypothetical protein